MDSLPLFAYSVTHSMEQIRLLRPHAEFHGYLKIKLPVVAAEREAALEYLRQNVLEKYWHVEGDMVLLYKYAEEAPPKPAAVPLAA